MTTSSGFAGRFCRSACRPAVAVGGRPITAPVLTAILCAAGLARGATLGVDSSWPAQYDTLQGSTAVSTLRPQCVNRADPVLASSGSQLEIATSLNYGLWPASGRADQSFPEQLFAFFIGVIPARGTIGQPQLLYDQLGGRFIMVATVYDNATQRGWLAIGTTAINEPRGITDCTLSFDANIQADGSLTNFWADNPRLGMTADAVAIAADMRAFDANKSFQYAKLWVIPKQNIYNPPFQSCPAGNAGFFLWSSLKNPDGSLASEVVPAKSYDRGSVTYLVSARSNGGNALNLWTLNSQGPSLSAAQAVPAQPYSPPPSAPQKRTASVPSPPLITTGDTRLVNAVYQPNSGLWTVHTTACPWNPALSCFKWYDIDPGSGTTIQDAFFGYTVDSAYAPAVAVSRNAAVFVFNSSSSNHFVDVDIVGRYAGDPANTLGQSLRVTPGVDVYTRGAPAFHNGADTDPTDDNRFWITGAWASGNAGGQNATCPDGTVNHDWVTQIGNLSFRGPFPPPPPPPGAGYYMVSSPARVVVPGVP
jgi:hypothetical protein